MRERLSAIYFSLVKFNLFFLTSQDFISCNNMSNLNQFIAFSVLNSAATSKMIFIIHFCLTNSIDYAVCTHGETFYSSLVFAVELPSLKAYFTNMKLVVPINEIAIKNHIHL